MIRKTEEIKYLDTTVTSALAHYAGYQSVVTNIAQGQTQNQRIGDNLNLLSLQFRFRLSLGSTPTDGPVRVIVYQWHDMSSGSDPVPADILQTIGTASSFLAPYAESQQKDYSILYDKTYTLTAAQRPVYCSPRISINGGKFMQRSMHFKPASSVLARNNLYLLFIGQNASGVTCPFIDFICRVRYTDS